eukprot:403344821
MSELYLRKNLISDLMEVKYLNLCSSLRVLWLSENPVSQHPLYRKFVIKMIPNLTKLDDSNISQEERQEALKLKITDQEIINQNPSQVVQESDYYQRQASHSSQQQLQQQQMNIVSPMERPKTTQQNRGRSPAAGGGLGPFGQNPQTQQQQITSIQQPQVSSNHMSNGPIAQNNQGPRNENILCAVLALLKELDENGLELVKRDIDKKIQLKKQQ